MLLFKQLSFSFFSSPKDSAPRAPMPAPPAARALVTPPASRGDAQLEKFARELLQPLGTTALALALRVEWNPRLRSAAGRASYHQNLVSLNPRLRDYGHAEIDRTLRHELAHLLAYSRAGRRRIQPHGREWRRACCDLGIGDEQRCHTLPFPIKRRARRFLYRCPRCNREFPRARRIRRGIACLACCRRYNGGHYEKRFKLRLVSGPTATSR